MSDGDLDNKLRPCSTCEHWTPFEPPLNVKGRLDWGNCDKLRQSKIVMFEKKCLFMTCSVFGCCEHSERKK